MEPSKQKKYLDLSHQIGSFIEYWGFKQVHGKVWTIIFLSKKSVDAKMIKETLGISKALVSMTLKDLLDYDVVQELPKDGPGSQKYTYNPDIISVILNVLQNREIKMLHQIQKSQAELKKKINKDDDTIYIKNLDQIGDMTSMAVDILGAFLANDNINTDKIYSSLST